MKTAVVFVLAACLVAVAMSVGGRISPSREDFARWRDCMVAKLPQDKVETYENCRNHSRGTDMRRFRQGLECVLSSYNLVNRTDVDLSRMRQLAQNVTQEEVRAAFQECPEDDKNKKVGRAVKCLIDHLETSCPVPDDAKRE
uniref:Putative secreted peptide n=1 Tax=Rhipicephalus pulchellus TaxID=72859 RepID=L7MC48_RHIPC